MKTSLFMVKKVNMELVPCNNINRVGINLVQIDHRPTIPHTKQVVHRLQTGSINEVTSSHLEHGVLLNTQKKTSVSLIVNCLNHNHHLS